MSFFDIMSGKLMPCVQYETALHRDRASDPQVLACLGRVWLLKGKQDKSVSAMKSSLDYSRRALAIATSQIHFKFNIAFVQIQLAQLIYTLPESQRTLAEVQAASEGLDDAIESFTEIAQAKNPPYPKHDIEQRANMGRNTMRRQLERAIQSQREYEEKNAARLQEARESREAEMKRREEERKRAEEIAAEEKRKIQDERNKILALNRELVEKRAEEERRKEELEYTTDSETGERVKRKKKSRAAGGKRKKKGEDSDTETEGDRPRRRKGAKGTEDETSGITSVDETRPRTKKKRKLARKGGKEDKFKSSEMVVDSDEDVDVAPAATNGGAKTNDAGEDAEMEDVGPTEVATGGEEVDDDGDEEEAISRPRKKPVRRIEESDEEEDEDDEDTPPPPMTTAEKAAAEDQGEDVSMVGQKVTAAGGGNDVEIPGGAGEAYPGVTGGGEAGA